jgi:hypothetical protein
MDGLDYTDVSEAWTRFDAPALDAPARGAFSEFEFDTSGDLGYTSYSGSSTGLPTVLWGAGGETAAWGDGGLAYAGLDGAPGAAGGVAGAPPARSFASKESLVAQQMAPGAQAQAQGAAARAYSASDLYDDASRVSCSNCQWTLEDPDWCCKNDCNDKSGPNFRQAYVCADPSDKTGKLTSACEVETECMRSEPPVLCSAGRLREMQKYNSVLDAKCAGRASTTAVPAYGTDAPYVGTYNGAVSITRAPTPYYTTAPVGRADRASWAQPTAAPWASRMPHGTRGPH